MSILRAETIAKIRKGVKEGIGATRLYWELREVGPVTRKTLFFADYRTVTKMEEKKDLLKYVRKDRYPTAKIYAATTWNIAKEYMYIVKIKTRLRPDEPIVQHDISIQSDVPMTPTMIEEQVIEERIAEEKYLGETIFEIIPWSASRRVAV